MRHNWMGGLISIAIALVGTAFTRDLQPVSAPNPPPGPDRYAVIAVEYKAFEWYMASWKGQKVVCSIITDHEGLPLPNEVYRDCGEKVYNKWITQKPCFTDKKSICDGYYVFLVNSWPIEKEIGMQLAPATTWISLEDCEPVFSSSTNICESRPIVVISGLEPLPNEAIIRVEGTYNGESFDCDGTDTCKFHIEETGPDGVTV
jgi:hypothetical protein